MTIFLTNFFSQKNEDQLHESNLTFFLILSIIRQVLRCNKIRFHFDHKGVPCFICSFSFISFFVLIYFNKWIKLKIIFLFHFNEGKVSKPNLKAYTKEQTVKERKTTELKWVTRTTKKPFKYFLCSFPHIQHFYGNNWLCFGLSSVSWTVF